MFIFILFFFLYLLLGGTFESELQPKPSSVKVPFLGSNRVRSQGRSGDKTVPLTNATSAARASDVDIDVKAIAMPPPHSPAKLPYRFPLQATMPTENEKNPNARSSNNANPNSPLPSPQSINFPVKIPTENQNSRPTQVYHNPLVAGRGRGSIVPYQVPLLATMPTENEKNPNATSVNNTNPNSSIPSPTEKQNSRPIQSFHNPLVAGRGRRIIVLSPNHPSVIVPNQGSMTPNAQNRTNG
jgi:hypothetical protein